MQRCITLIFEMNILGFVLERHSQIYLNKKNVIALHKKKRLFINQKNWSEKNLTLRQLANYSNHLPQPIVLNKTCTIFLRNC